MDKRRRLASFPGCLKLTARSPVLVPLSISMPIRRRLAGTRPRLYGQFPVQFKRRAAARLFPGSLKFGILYEFDIFLIMPGHFIIMERETFGNPADEEPETAEEYEKLENPVNQGIGFPR